MSVPGFRLKRRTGLLAKKSWEEATKLNELGMVFGRLYYQSGNARAGLMEGQYKGVHLGAWLKKKPENTFRAYEFQMTENHKADKNGQLIVKKKEKFVFLKNRD